MAAEASAQRSDLGTECDSAKVGAILMRSFMDSMWKISVTTRTKVTSLTSNRDVIVSTAFFLGELAAFLASVKPSVTRQGGE